MFSISGSTENKLLIRFSKKPSAVLYIPNPHSPAQKNPHASPAAVGPAAAALAPFLGWHHRTSFYTPNLGTQKSFNFR
jgi:hypothetical protein